jgi:uncharacterized membrane protein YdfJ with MMPL/SSD domain
VEPILIVPEPESRVRSLVAPTLCRLTLPSLAAALVICRKWLLPLAVWMSKTLPEVAVPEVCLKVLPMLLAVGAKVLAASSLAKFALSDRLVLAIVLQLPPVTNPPVEAKEAT